MNDEKVLLLLELVKKTKNDLLLIESELNKLLSKKKVSAKKKTNAELNAEIKSKFYKR